MFYHNSIKKKLITWFLLSLLVFVGTMLVLYANVLQIGRISDRIVSRNYEISSEAKKMLEDLLSMEEYEKKYRLLKKEDYLHFFLAAAAGYEKSLGALLNLEKKGFRLNGPWKTLHRDFRRVALPVASTNTHSGGERDIWVPEERIDNWIQQITDGIAANDRETLSANRELKRQGQAFARHVLIGIAVSGLVGAVFVVFLTYSMIRPLRELRRGIRAIAADRAGEPVQVRSDDEFGELAQAFNEMSTQLMEEEQLRSDFISMLSHEIRTPLTSIRESVSMIAEEIMGPINERQRKFLNIAADEIGRISGLLKYLMQVSRLQSGALPINPRPIETAKFLVGCVARLRHVAEKKQIRITTQIPAGLPQLLADPEHLQQVFVNLLGNAVKFSPPGTQVVLRAETAKGKKRVLVYVSDSGPGIPEDEQAFVFKKYYRAKSVRNHMDGVGLGLSIAKHIVEIHRGGIWVESKGRQGTTFGVTLPAAS